MEPPSKPAEDSASPETNVKTGGFWSKFLPGSSSSSANATTKKGSIGQKTLEKNRTQEDMREPNNSQVSLNSPVAGNQRELKMSADRSQPPKLTQSKSTILAPVSVVGSETAENNQTGNPGIGSNQQGSIVSLQVSDLDLGDTRSDFGSLIDGDDVNDDATLEPDAEYDAIIQELFPAQTSDPALQLSIQNGMSTASSHTGSSRKPKLSTDSAHPLTISSVNMVPHQLSMSARLPDAAASVAGTPLMSTSTTRLLVNANVPVSAPTTNATTATTQQLQQQAAAEMVMIRVFRRDGTFSTLSCSPNMSARELCLVLGRKFFLASDVMGSYQLWLEFQGSEWLIMADEKPVKIQQRLLVDQGYDLKVDRINDVLREDHAHLFRWIYSDMSAFQFNLDTWTSYAQASINFQPENSVEQKIAECGAYLRDEDTHQVAASHVDLSGCGVSSIPAPILKRFQVASSADLSQNFGIQLLSDFFVTAKMLTMLNLSSCHLFRVPAGVGQLRTLETLDLSNNFIVTLKDSELGQLPGLRNLKLRNNRLRGRAALPISIVKNWSLLEKLDLGCNFLRGSLPRAILLIGAGSDDADQILIKPSDAATSSLTELDLSFNWLTSLPEEMGYRLPRLRKLVLFSNLLTKLPESLQRYCLDLETLDVRSNSIKGVLGYRTIDGQIDSSVEGHRISRLVVTNNNFSELQVNRQLPLLRSIISNRNSTLLQVGLSTLLPNLTTIVLSCSKLASIPENTFLHTPFLQVLVLNNNQLTGLPSSLNSLSCLVRLDASNNSISSVPSSIKELKSLEILDLHSNNIKTIPPEIWELKLCYLNLSSNIIETWSENPFLNYFSSQGSDRMSGTSVVSNNRRSAFVFTAPLDLSPVSDRRQTQRISSSPGAGTLQISPLTHSLRWLSVADNRIESSFFENPISQLFALQALNVAQNDLFAIPSGSLKNSAGTLEELILSGNQLTQLPEELYSFKKLKRLYVNGNRLGSLPPELGKLAQLRILDAGRNQLRYNVNNWPFDWNWNWNADLRYLNLSGNPRLEIKPQQVLKPVSEPGAKKDKSSKDKQVEVEQSGKGDMARFDLLQKLRILGLMEVSVTIPLPDETNRRRIRVLAQGGASTNWKKHAIPDDAPSSVSTATPVSPPQSASPLLAVSAGAPISGPVSAPENNNVTPPVSFGLADSLGSGESIHIWDMVVLNTKWLQVAREEARAAALAANGSSTPQPRRSLKPVEHMFCLFESDSQIGSWLAKQVTETFGIRFASELKRLLKDNSLKKDVLTESAMIQFGIRRTFLNIEKHLGNQAAVQKTKFRSRLDPEELAELAKRQAQKSRTSDYNNEGNADGSQQQSSRWRRLASSSDLTSKLKKLAKDEPQQPQQPVNNTTTSTPSLGRKSRRSSAANENEMIKSRFTKLNEVKEVSLDELPTAAVSAPRTRTASVTSTNLLQSTGPGSQSQKEAALNSLSTNISAEHMDSFSENSYDSLFDFGISGLVAYISTNQLFIANVGDSTAVLCRNGSATPLSTKHNLFSYFASAASSGSSERQPSIVGENEQASATSSGDKAVQKPKVESWSQFARREQHRLRRSGATLNSDGSIGSSSFLTRQLGSFKNSSLVIPQPSIISMEISDQDEFLIIASREFWKTMSYQTAVDIARLKADDALEAAMVLRDFAISYSSRYNFVVDFEGERPDERHKLTSCGAKSGTLLTVPRDQFTVLVINLRDCTANKTQKKVFNRIRKKKEEVMDSAIARLAPEVEPPTGFLAIVFTDVRNSTQLWERKPVSMRVAIREHNLIMRRNLRFFNGYEVKTEGDAFMVAFKSVLDAMCWCLTVQQQLLEADWPQDLLDLSDGQSVYGPKIHNDSKSEKALLYRGLSVRMGMHCGTPVCEPDPITRRMDYFGPMVNKTARVSGNADGGQLLVSTDVERVIRQMKAGTFIEDQGSNKGKVASMNEKLVNLSHLEPTFFDIGERKLKGFDNPEVLYSVYPSNLASRHEIPPPPASGELAGKSAAEEAEAEAEKLEAMTSHSLETKQKDKHALKSSASNLKPTEQMSNIVKTLEHLQLEQILGRIQNAALFALAKKFQPSLISGSANSNSPPGISAMEEITKWRHMQSNSSSQSLSSFDSLEEVIRQLELCVSALQVGIDDSAQPELQEIMQSLRWLLEISIKK